MKVLMLGRWPNFINGGVSVHTVNLFNELSKFSEVEITFISFGEKKKIIKKGRSKVILLKERKIYHFLPFLALFKLSYEIRKISPEIIHLQGFNISPYLFYTLFSTKVKKIITCHGISSKEHVAQNRLKSTSISYKLMRWIEKIEIEKADAIICVGSKLRELIINDYNVNKKQNIYFIPNGVDINKFNFQSNKKIARDKLNILSGDMVVFHAKSFVHNNGQKYLIEAFDRLLKVLPSSKLILVGEGPLKTDLINLSRKLQISDKIFFLGNVKNELIPSLMAASDFVVIPSISINELEETSCILALEAMAMKKPIIATKVGGLPDSITDGYNGLLVPDKDSNKIYKGIVKLCENPHLSSELGNNGYYYVKNERKWSKIALDTLKVYKGVI